MNPAIKYGSGDEVVRSILRKFSYFVGAIEQAEQLSARAEGRVDLVNAALEPRDNALQQRKEVLDLLQSAISDLGEIGDQNDISD